MASSCSAQERTTPDRVTDPGEAETDSPLGVQPGAARERAANVVLDVAPVGRGEQLDPVLDAEDARHVGHDELGLVALVLPAGGAGQGDEAAGHPGVHV